MAASRPPALATTSLADYAADLEKLIGEMKTPPILVGHSLGGLLAQMLAARCDVAAAMLLAPSAPWGVPPSTLFEIGAAQSLMLRVGFWSMILEPDFDIAAAHSLDRFAKDQSAGAVRADSCPESGRATFEILHWGLDMGRASEVDVRKVALSAAVSGRRRRSHQSARARSSVPPRSTRIAPNSKSCPA